MIQVEQLPLWDVLMKADDVHRARVKELIERAASTLDRVIETFPTYTLHNSTHAVNVVSLMADLLGPARSQLRPLEASLLLLSAFYHDIGMVFDQDARNRLTEEPEWKSFLETKPDAYLAVKHAGSVPEEIAEWYCRWRHAERVHVHLRLASSELLKWGQTSLRERLGELCESHNHDVADLYRLPIDFRSEADLRFCAILLRLADILDFDHTRTPEEVYEYLGLSRRNEPRKVESDVEWRKHLCSEGFRFPEQRVEGYLLPFVAGPDEPGVEHDVREFLDSIDGELEKCRALQAGCSDRWRTLPLPGAIDRSNIVSDGYRYAEYRFTLDQAQVMDILMGESLYRDSYVFVRELIQNALDTSRHRRFIERMRGNSSFQIKPIQVRQWVDQDGYRWVRFDDEGMGMDEEIVRKHLLKVGSSYYRSSGFRAEILRVQEKVNEDFVPISRFGIGLLSCFMVGDRIEISTLRHSADGRSAEPIRLALNGLRGFFTLQTPNLPPKPMPVPFGEETEYRSSPGTSIAVRLDPGKEKEVFDLESHLSRYLSCPPVPVELDGERIGGNPEILVDKPWCENVFYELSTHEMAPFEAMTGVAFSEPLTISFWAVDLTKHSPTRDLKGQIVLAFVRGGQEWEEAVRTNSLSVHLEYSDLTPLGLNLRTRYGAPVSANVVFEFPNREMSEVVQLLEGRTFSWLSHNGVAVPTIEVAELALRHRLPGPVWCQGIVALYDSLRPELSVSRDGLLSLPWTIYSAGGLALYRALNELGFDLRSRHWDLFSGDPSRGNSLALGTLLEDEHLRDDADWASLPIITTDRGLLSLQEIRERSRSELIRITLPKKRYGRDFLDWCSATLIQTGLYVAVDWTLDARELSLIVSGDASSEVTEGHKLFPPLTFLPFVGASHLGEQGSVLNLKHPFSIWLLAKAPEIAKRYPGLFEQIQSNLLVGTFLRESEGIASLNRVLNRLRELHADVRPPRKLVLKDEDFGSEQNFG